MLTHKKIENAVKKVSVHFPITKVAYFGSYANGNATAQSDLDLLIEFEERDVSLLTLIGFKQQIEDELGVKVDVVHSPVPQSAIINIKKEVYVYG